MGLGLFYRPDQVGYYQNAITLYENSIVSALIQVHTVGSAALSELQSNPVASAKIRSGIVCTGVLRHARGSDPVGNGPRVTVLLLGEKWRAAGSLLSIIALRGIFQAVEGSQGWLHFSTGRADRWQNWGIVSLGVQVVAVLGGLPFGATGVAVSGVIASVLIALPSISYAGRPIGVGAALVIRAVGPQLIGAISTAVGGWWLQTMILTDYSGFVRIFLSSCFCICIYLTIVVGLFRLTEPIKVASSIVQDLLRKQ